MEVNKNEPVYQPTEALIQAVKHQVQLHPTNDLLRLILNMLYLPQKHQQELWANAWIIYSLLNEQNAMAMRVPQTEIVISVEKKYKRMINADA